MATVFDGQWSGFAKGGVFANSPSLSAYSGGVYDSPQLFKFARGAGVFGEAGPESIMPLRRGPDGRLGVTAYGGASPISISTMVNVDASGQSNSQTTASQADAAARQLAAEMEATAKRVVARAMQPGGILWRREHA